MEDGEGAELEQLGSESEGALRGDDEAQAVVPHETRAVDDVVTEPTRLLTLH